MPVHLLCGGAPTIPGFCNENHGPLLWVRGDSDQIVSDTSPLDVGYLGSIGAIPGWPGEEEYPAQPMVAQTRAVLQQAVAMGGTLVEEVFTDCGHSPHLEQPDRFREVFTGFVATAEAARRGESP